MRRLSVGEVADLAEALVKYLTGTLIEHHFGTSINSVTLAL